MFLGLLLACVAQPVKFISFNGQEVYDPFRIENSSDTQPDEILLELEPGEKLKIDIKYRGARIFSSGAPGHIELDEITGKGSIQLYDEMPGPGLWYITVFDESSEHFVETRIMYFTPRDTGDTGL